MQDVLDGLDNLMVPSGVRLLHIVRTVHQVVDGSDTHRGATEEVPAGARRRVFQPKSVPAEESVKNGDVRSSAKGEKSVRESFEKRRKSPRESEPSEEM